VGDHATAVETYVPHSASNEIFMALRQRSDDAARRGTADDLQGPSRHQALTILHTSICDKAGHCDFTGRMLTSPVRPRNFSARPGPMAFQNYRARAEWAGPPGPCRVLLQTSNLGNRSRDPEFIDLLSGYYITPSRPRGCSDWR